MAGERPADALCLRPDLSPQLAQFLQKACAPYHKERFGNAREMRDALSEIRASRAT